MIYVPTPTHLSFSRDERTMELADFLQQDEQEVLQALEQELDQLVVNPSEFSIQKILNYAASF